MCVLFQSSPETDEFFLWSHTFVFFSLPIYYPRTSLALPTTVSPSSNSDPGSHKAYPFHPSPQRYAPSFLPREQFGIFFPRRLRRIVPIPTLLLIVIGVLNSSSSLRPFGCCFFFANNSKSHHGVGVELNDQLQ